MLQEGWVHVAHKKANPMNMVLFDVVYLQMSKHSWSSPAGLWTISDPKVCFMRGAHRSAYPWAMVHASRHM